ncbi:hypothetical protein PR048_028336 [Dryococelus australis]|uniref:Uncharacterized protein n=1 Tax=Dryococelus australis TaxID=614101 RepID=A0ABQ9GJ11_9NEOP|nr:hypothetical protein PR048_028336 [Dryococelus australis]
MVAFMETVKAKGIKNKFPFQDGIQISSKYGTSENRHPGPINFKYRIRIYITGKHSSAIFSSKADTEDRVDETCLYTEISRLLKTRDVSQKLGNYVSENKLILFGTNQTQVEQHL